MTPPADARRAWRLATGGLVLVAAVLVGPRLLLLTVPFHLNYNEGWNLYRVALVQAGGQLYGAPPQFWVTNYPPLSFHIAALLDRLVGDLSLTGRLLSLLGLLGTSLSVGAVVRRLTANRLAALYAALLVPIWFTLYQASRIPMNDPQLLATGFVAFGTYAYVRAGGPVWLVASAAAFAVGLFTKHNLFDMPLAVGLHLLVARRWRELLAWAGAGALAGFGLLAASLAVDGPHFLAHVLIPRDYVPYKGIRMTGGFLAYFAGALLVAVLWGRRQRVGSPRGLLVLQLAVCFLVGVALAPGGGLDRNNYFDTLVALAMVAGVAVHDMLGAPAWRRPALAALLLALPLLPALAKLPERIGNIADTLRAAPRDAQEFAAGVRLLAGLRPPALCENMQLCFAAGQPLDYEPFFVDDRMRRGRIDPAEVMALLRARHWGAVVLDIWPDSPLLPGVARERFTAPVVDAILANYHPVYTASSFVILVPRDAGSPQGGRSPPFPARVSR